MFIGVRCSDLSKPGTDACTREIYVDHEISSFHGIIEHNCIDIKVTLLRGPSLESESDV